MMRKHLVFFVFCLLVFLLTGGAAFAENVCFECHDKNNFQNKVVHKPVSSGKCTQCHNPHVARYDGLLRVQEGRLCFSCHMEKEAALQKGYVHDPVAQGSCTVCHDPHASAGKSLIPAELSLSCFRCHEKLPQQQQYTYTHDPYLKGECIACHSPHNSDRPLLLSMEEDDLCLSCHKKQNLAVRHKNYPGEIRQCMTCHNPHGSERPFLVRNVLHKPYEEGCKTCHGKGKIETATCLECHEAVGTEMRSTHNHLTRQTGNSCINCHSPHAGDDRGHLRGPLKTICSSCHQVSINAFKKSPFKHPNIENCVDCHEPHASSNLAFLKGDGVEVCSKCHKAQGAFSHPIGPNVLDPRTGQVMTCVTCHKPMGTDYPYHLVKDKEKGLCLLCHRTY